MAERCLLVLPTYNHVAHLRSLVEEILLVGDLLGEPTLNVLVIDDHSTDGTATTAEDLKQEYRQRVYVLHRLEQLGAASAYTIGFRYALASGYDYVVQMAADRTHNPSTLPQLLRSARDADLVLASRYAQVDGSAIRRAARAIFRTLAISHSKLALGVPIADPGSGYTCLSRRTLTQVALAGLRTEGSTFQVELTYRCAQSGLRVVEVPLASGPGRRQRFRLPGATVWESLRLLFELRLGSIVLFGSRPLLGVPVEQTHRPHRRRT